MTVKSSGTYGGITPADYLEELANRCVCVCEFSEINYLLHMYDAAFLLLH